MQNLLENFKKSEENWSYSRKRFLSSKYGYNLESWTSNVSQKDVKSDLLDFPCGAGEESEGGMRNSKKNRKHGGNWMCVRCRI